MSRGVTCPRESEVLEFVSRAQWPRLADAELQAHADACPLCTELLAAAGAVVDLRDDQSRPPALPEASLVWYRAQVRARAEAERRAAGPMLIAQGLAVTAVLALGLVFWTDAVGWLQSWWTSPQRFWSAGLPSFEAAWTALSVPVLWVLGGALALWLVILPLALAIARLADRVDGPSEPLLPRAKD